MLAESDPAMNAVTEPPIFEAAVTQGREAEETLPPRCSSTASVLRRREAEIGRALRIGGRSARKAILVVMNMAGMRRRKSVARVVGEALR